MTWIEDPISVSQVQAESVTLHYTIRYHRCTLHYTTKTVGCSMEQNRTGAGGYLVRERGVPKDFVVAAMISWVVTLCDDFTNPYSLYSQVRG